VVCLAPRALGDCAPSALSGVVVRPLNFTVRRRYTACQPRWYDFAAGLRLNVVLETDSHPKRTSSNNMLWQKKD
jgi:hypothetical protein